MKPETALPEHDGIRSLLAREHMTEAARKVRDFYARVPGAPLVRREFGYYCLDAWHEQGLAKDANFAELFQYDEPAKFTLFGLGWCEAAFVPVFETLVLEDRGEYELVQDFAGRSVLCFKGRRDGFMPEYVDHPVKDERTWQENIRWRLDPAAPGRFDYLATEIEKAKAAAAKGLVITQGLVGAYMYLRSLVGPEELLYMFYDKPELLHDCMTVWFELSDTVIAKHQEHVTFDEIFFAEDICYNGGPLISPEMIREFILPYYQQLITNLKSRQIDKDRHLYIQIDTDGNSVPVIPLYKQVGMDVMSPFEVASGCDVVKIGRDNPDLAMTGGIDKRVLAESKEAIDRHVEYILPAMRERGGYIPTCDHGVPAEVSLENYMHYRKRCVELGG